MGIAPIERTSADVLLYDRDARAREPRPYDRFLPFTFCLLPSTFYLTPNNTSTVN
jgi:hypothetical protein